MSSTPPTSPQCHQEAARHAEHSSRLMASPEQHRTPAGPSAASTSTALPPSIAGPSLGGPVTYGEQTYGFLTSEVVAGIHNLLPIPPPVSRRRGCPSSTLAPPPVGLIFILIHKSNIKLADDHKTSFCWPICCLYLYFCCSCIYLCLCLCFCSKSCSCPSRFLILYLNQLLIHTYNL